MLGRDAAPAGVVRSHVPGRHSGSLTGALSTPARSDCRERRKPGCRCGALVGETQLSRAASGPLITGRPEKIRAGLAKSRSRVISARHTPRMGGTEKRRALPRPTQVRDQQSVGFLHSGHAPEKAEIAQGIRPMNEIEPPTTDEPIRATPRQREP